MFCAIAGGIASALACGAMSKLFSGLFPYTTLFRSFKTLAPQLFEATARASADAEIIVGSGVQLAGMSIADLRRVPYRSEEHTSELQSRRDLVCRLLLEKKKIVWIRSKSRLRWHSR